MVAGRRALSLLMGLCLGPVGLAQVPQPLTREEVLAPPTPIQFPNWKEIEESETSIEYLETFPSAVTTPFPTNNQVPLHVFLPANQTGPVSVVLITHYWGARDLRAEVALAQDLNDRGIGAAIMELPYHLGRTPPGYVSGSLAIVPDVKALEQTMLQAELDARRSLDFLDTRSEVKHGSYGLVGTSLGALVAGLVYAIEPRVTEATFVLGGADLARILWTSSRVVQVRDALRRQGWTESRLRAALEAVEPLSYLPRSAPGATFVIYGRYDTVVPNECTRELMAHLSQPRSLELETGHYGGLFVKGKVLNVVSDFFADQMAGRTYTPPAGLVAPTIRIGVLAAVPPDIDLFAGLDLIHFDRKSLNFASLLATPRGLRLFLGRQLGQGFSLGAVGSNKGIGVGFVWSTVL